jgi:hypothetical protein
MIHHSTLKEHAPRFPADGAGFVPEAADNWRQMQFDHKDQNPEEPGISAEERQRRLDYLDKQWWPQLLAQVRTEHEALVAEGHPSPFKSWIENVRPGSGDVGPGISVAGIDQS